MATIPNTVNVGTGYKIRVIASNPALATTVDEENFEVLSVCANQINTGNVAPSISGNYCTGSTITIPYTTFGTFAGGNIFKAQLSDDNGNNFVDVPSIVGNNTVLATIPDGLIDGDFYRFRIVSTDPQITGTMATQYLRIRNSDLETILSSQTGNWNDPNVWTCSRIPISQRTVVINAGQTVTAPSGSASTVATLTLNGELNFGNNPLPNSSFSLAKIANVLTSGSLNITSSLLVASTGIINAKIYSSTDYDKIVVGGQVNLNGVLNVTFDTGYVPMAGNSFSIISYGSKTGAFSTINLPSLPNNMTWETTYSATGLIFTIKQIIVNVAVSGNVFNDPNAGNLNNSSGDANLVPAGMTAYLVKDGAVVGAGAPVASNGAFTFGSVAPGTGYTVVLSTTPPVGTTSPVVTLPAGWLKTGEFNGAPDGGTDATVDGKSAAFDVVATDVMNRNFGIQQPPTANIIDLGTVPNPGGTTTKDVTSGFGGADPTTTGIVASLTVTSLPAGVTSITINGTKYGTGFETIPPEGINTLTDANGVPISPILIDPIDGNVLIKASYVTIDNAGISSQILGEVKVLFTTTALPIVLLDLSGKQMEFTINLAWKTVNEKNFNHFEVMKSPDSKEFGTIGKVNGNSHSFYNFIDTNPTEGQNYYKLKMVDLDGTFAFSKVIAVNFEKNGYYLSFENPVKNGEIFVKSNYPNPNFSVLNSIGKKIEITFVKTDNNQYKIKTKTTTTGICFLMLESEGNLITRKILVE